MTAASLPETIDIVVSVPDDAGSSGDMGIFSRDTAAEVAAVSVATLHKNFATTLEALKEVFSGLPDLAATLTLETVQLSFEVTATGKVALLGTSAQLTGRGAITLTFARRVADER